MYVGIAKLEVVLGASHSLKDKRMVVRRIKDRVRDRVGVVVNEVGEQDVWQRAELGVAVASADRAKALELIDQVVRVAIAAGGSDGAIVSIAKDVITFEGERGYRGEGEAVVAAVDDRTGTGDKAAGDDGWIPDAWREELK